MKVIFEKIMVLSSALFIAYLIACYLGHFGL